MNWHQNIFKELKIFLKYSTLVFTYLHTCFRDVQYIRLIMFFKQIVFMYQCLCIIGLDFLGVILISFYSVNNISTLTLVSVLWFLRCFSTMYEIMLFISVHLCYMLQHSNVFEQLFSVDHVMLFYSLKAQMFLCLHLT